VKLVAVVIAVLFAVYGLAVLAVGLVFPPVKPRTATERDRFADVLGARMAYRVTEGNGPTVVLLHGFGGNLLGWEGMLHKLTCGRLISVDLLGFGLSSKPSLTYDLETHRRHLIGLFDALGIERVVLVGASFGASLTLWTAAHTPERVAGAVAMAPSGMPGQLTAPWPRSFLFRPGAPNRLASLLAHSPLFEVLFADSQARQALGISGSYGAGFEAAMPKIKQPTLLLWSPGDPTAPFSYSDRYLKAIPQAELILFDPSSGHAIASAEPDRAAEYICEFVKALDPAADPPHGR
jgi:pimeloyl-ACP methyl ester carboxylesterase